jgi:dihydrodiol dehydrogenase / D-xylose 1-dehydrogenase (NADP)
VAVGARNLEDAQKFAEKHSIPAAYGSYEELSRDPSVGPSAFSIIVAW